jgi:hypothetical protein
MADHKLTGEINVSEKLLQKVPSLPGTVSLDTAGIDMFHMILHMVFAHKFGPVRLTDKSTKQDMMDNRKQAFEYLKIHVVAGRMHTDVEYPEDYIAEYKIQHMNRPEIRRIRIDPREGLDRCVSVQAANGVFVPVDLRSLAVQTPV